MAINFWDPQGNLWARVHVKEHLWDAMEAIAERDGVPVDDYVNDALREMLERFEAPPIRFGLPRSRKGGVR